MIMNFNEFLIESNNNDNNHLSNMMGEDGIFYLMGSYPYIDIKKYLNSLYKQTNNKYVEIMLSNISDILINTERNIQYRIEVLDSILSALIDIDISFRKKWKGSKKGGIEKLRKYVKSFLNDLVIVNNLTTGVVEDKIKHFIENKINRLTSDYSEYEDSFTEYGIFSKNNSSLFLGRLGRLKEYVFTNRIEKQEIIEDFKSLLKNIENMKLKKHDIESEKVIKLDNNKTLINKGDVIEVKYKNYNEIGVLGEFFALSKGKVHKNLIENIDISLDDGDRTDDLYTIYRIFKNNDNIRNKYNDIISEFFRILINGEYKMILDIIKDGMNGMMFNNNIFTPSSNIDLRWTISGLRSDANRLSVMYKVKNLDEVYTYHHNEEFDPSEPYFTKVI